MKKIYYTLAFIIGTVVFASCGDATPEATDETCVEACDTTATDEAQSTDEAQTVEVAE